MAAGIGQQDPRHLAYSGLPSGMMDRFNTISPKLEHSLSSGALLAQQDTQLPGIIAICCVYSHEICAILNLKAGDAFVINSLGAIVPKFDPNDKISELVAANLQYGHKVLGEKYYKKYNKIQSLLLETNIVALEMLADKILNPDKNNTLIVEWLEKCIPNSVAELRKTQNKKDFYNNAMKESMSNVLTYPEIQKSVDENKLTISAMIVTPKKDDVPASFEIIEGSDKQQLIVCKKGTNIADLDKTKDIRFFEEENLDPSNLPKKLVITCADSRVEIRAITDHLDTLIIRNAGGLPIEDLILLVLTTYPSIEEIEFVGHTQCGAMDCTVHPHDHIEMVTSYLNHNSFNLKDIKIQESVLDFLISKKNINPVNAKQILQDFITNSDELKKQDRALWTEILTQFTISNLEIQKDKTQKLVEQKFPGRKMTFHAHMLDLAEKRLDPHVVGSTCVASGVAYTSPAMMHSEQHIGSQNQTGKSLAL